MSWLDSPRRTALLIIAAWLTLTLLALFSHHVTAIDETRYLSAAWEMWLRGDWLVPHLNGVPYHHKPPLLFWLINLSWSLFGVSEWAARLIPALLGLTGALLAIPMAALIWPDRPRLQSLAAWMLFSIAFWTFWSTAMMFDLLVAVCAEVALLGLLLAWRRSPVRGWVLAGIGIGLGILAKGPVIFVYVLPVLLLAPAWMKEQRPLSWFAWYGGGAAAILLGAAIGLGWALPAAAAGGEDYANHLLWGQTAGRVVESFAHRRPFWWYLPQLPLLLFPWSLWPPLWRGMRARWREGWDSGERLTLLGALTALAVFSLISGKQVHYLLPFFPLVALYAARAMEATAADRVRYWFYLVSGVPLLLIGGLVMVAPGSGLLEGEAIWVDLLSPWDGVLIVAAVTLVLALARRLPSPLWPGMASLLFLAACLEGLVGDVTRYYEVNEIGEAIGKAQREGHSVAVFGKYHGQFNFVGRLERPIQEIDFNALDDWLAGHPDGLIVIHTKQPPEADEPGVRHWQYYRTAYLELRDAASWKPNKAEAGL